MFKLFTFQVTNKKQRQYKQKLNIKHTSRDFRYEGLDYKTQDTAGRLEMCPAVVRQYVYYGVRRLVFLHHDVYDCLSNTDINVQNAVYTLVVCITHQK